MDFWLATNDNFDYNDEYYYSTEGVNVIGAYATEELAHQQGKEYFIKNYNFLCDSIESDDLAEFISALGLPPLDRNIYSVPPELQAQYMEKTWAWAGHVAKMTVQES